MIALRNDPNKSTLITTFKSGDEDEFQFRDVNNFMDPINNPSYGRYIQTRYKLLLQTSNLLYDQVLIIIQNRSFESI